MDRAQLDASITKISVALSILLTSSLAALAQPAEEQPEGESTILELPAPSGPHAVGYRQFHWTDRSRKEGATPAPDDFRQLFVQLWYPAAKPAAGTKKTPYFRQLDAYVEVFGEARVNHLRRVRAHSIPEAEIDRALPTVPVLLFSHGWQAQGAAYTALLEDVASHGYLVAAIDQPFQGRIAMPDGTVTPATEDHFADPMEMVAFYGRDQQFVLDRLRELDQKGGIFAGRLALTRVGCLGHSNGAVGAMQAAKADDRVAAVAALDSWDPAFESLFALGVPLLLLRHGEAPEPSTAYARSAEAGLYDAQIRGGEHLSALDWPWIDATDAEKRASRGRVSSSISRILVSFFEMQLKGKDEADFLSLGAQEDIEIRSLAASE